MLLKKPLCTGDLLPARKILKGLHRYNYCHSFVTCSSSNSGELHENQQISNNKNFRHRLIRKY